MNFIFSKHAYINTFAGPMKAAEAVERNVGFIDVGRFGDIDVSKLRHATDEDIKNLPDGFYLREMNSNMGKIIVTSSDLTIPLKPHRAWVASRNEEKENEFRELVAENYEMSETHHEHRIYINELATHEIAEMEYTLPFYGIDVESHLAEGYLALDKGRPACWVSTWVSNDFNSLVRKLPEFIISGWFKASMDFDELIPYIAKTGAIPPGHVTLDEVIPPPWWRNEEAKENTENLVVAEANYGIQVNNIYFPFKKLETQTGDKNAEDKTS